MDLGEIKFQKIEEKGSKRYCTFLVENIVIEREYTDRLLIKKEEISVPGFRKGRVSERILKSYFSSSILKEIRADIVALTVRKASTMEEIKDVKTIFLGIEGCMDISPFSDFSVTLVFNTVNEAREKRDE